MFCEKCMLYLLLIITYRLHRLQDMRERALERYQHESEEQRCVLCFVKCVCLLLLIIYRQHRLQDMTERVSERHQHESEEQNCVLCSVKCVCCIYCSS